MKKVLLVLTLAVLFFSGCTTVQIPAYLANKKPFTQRFYAGHDRVLHAVRQSLNELGWTVEQEVEPGVYEIQPGIPEQGESSLLMTKVRAARLVLSSRYSRMNVYIRSFDGVSEVEVRYLLITDWGIFKQTSYGNEALAQKFFNRVQKSLE